MSKVDLPIEVLIQELHSADWTTRCDAARLLGQSGDPRAVDALLPDLQNSDWRVRRNAAQALGALRDPRATEPLLASLKDRTMTVRQRAIVALGRIKDMRALPALLDLVLEGKHESYEASKAIRKFGKKAILEIVKVFERTNDQELLLLLVDLKYSGAFELLVKLLHSHELASRQAAIRELGKLRDKRAIPYLIEQLKDSDSILQNEVVTALGQLRATESIPALLGLLKDDELYGPNSAAYRAVTNAFQLLAGITNEIQNAFPGKYPAMFNMGGAAFSLPEAMGRLGNQANLLNEALSRFAEGSTESNALHPSIADAMRKAMEATAWKFGVMFADARDAKDEHLKHLIALLKSKSSLQRAAAALSLPWYGEERALEPLQQLTHDPDPMVQIAAAWAAGALQRALSYRNPFDT